nr:hypothetical protein [Tanacetum cinerariifolium]
DEDRLKLMELMVFLLQKGVCDEIGITTARLSSYCCQANVSAVCFKTLLSLNAQVTSLEVVTAAASQVSAASTTIPAASATIPAAKPTIPAALTVLAAYTRRRKGVIIRDPKEELHLKTPDETLKVKDKGKGILVETPKPLKKKDQIEMDAEYAKKLQEEINKDYEKCNKDIDWDAAMDHVNQKSSNPQNIKRYQGMKKRPQTGSEAHKNI